MDERSRRQFKEWLAAPWMEAGDWVLSADSWKARKDVLVARGGAAVPDGHYILVTHDGRIEAGRFEGMLTRFPIFQPEFNEKVGGTLDEALEYAVRELGCGFLAPIALQAAWYDEGGAR